jgi:hypothetical protein
MKSLKLLTIVLFAFCNFANAKDTIYVSQDKVTSLAFTHSITSVNALKSSLVFDVREQTILLKANATNFTSTDLKVTTDDGSQFEFSVLYSYGRAGKHLKATHPKPTLKVKTDHNNFGEILRLQKRISSIDRFLVGKIKASVGKVLVSGDSLFFKLRLENRSNINYDIDFIRFYVRDLKKAKRTVTQERELYPIQVIGSAYTQVKSKTQQNYSYVLNKFPLTKDRGLFIEIYEQNGGRHLYLQVTQTDIIKAKTIQSILKQNK